MSCFCILFVRRQEGAQEKKMAAAMRQLMKQLKDLHDNPIDGITLKQGDSITQIEAELKGPEDTPYAGGVFTVVLVFGDTYPEQPPKGNFKTKIFHPNVSEKGEICVNALKRDWTPDITIGHILSVVRCLLIEPNPESALNEEAGRLLLEEYQEFAKRARIFTSIHAGASGQALPALRTAESTNTPAGNVAATADRKAAEKKKAMLKRL
jgi:ubiquitin-conjugating enzyme E2 S